MAPARMAGAHENAPEAGASSPHHRNSRARSDRGLAALFLFLGLGRSVGLVGFLLGLGRVLLGIRCRSFGGLGVGFGRLRRLLGLFRGLGGIFGLLLVG